MSSTILHVFGCLLLFLFLTGIGTCVTHYIGNDDHIALDARTTWRESLCCALIVEVIVGVVIGIIYTIVRLLAA